MNKPTGIVTFLFTDIEGSTRLAQEFPEKLQVALERHHLIMNDAIESNNGFTFEIIGDAFCCAFERAEDAVKAAVDAQLNLVIEKWEEAVIKVRIGIHTGNAEWSGNRYMGYITLARAARVMSSAYGGQIIISNDTYELTKDKFYRANEESVSFRDLGERRLKDVIEPIRLFQVLTTGLREDFPPLKTLDARPNNLPLQLTSFIGREKVIQQVKNMFEQTRLLTLIGSGGSGKTRLAMQVGAEMIDEFSNGVYITELAPVSDPVFIESAILNSLGIKEVPGTSPEETLTCFLKDKEMLLISDNCEHLINECADLSERLLSKCTKLKIIATSREALNCKGERTFLIPPLTLPDISVNNTPEQITQYEAVRLFIERALSVNPKFRVNRENAPALAGICSSLDGIPLAIELAAARIKIMTLEKIYERLNDRFGLLTGGKRTALPRQQTLRAMIDWSYDLLSSKEQLLLRRLSIFMGGWTLEAAEEICSDESIDQNEVLDIMNSLLDKSLIMHIESGGKSRYGILESIKYYSLEKLTDNKKEYQKHLDYFINLFSLSDYNEKGFGVHDWISLTGPEIDNMRMCIQRGSEINPEDTVRLVINAFDFFIFKSYVREGFETSEKILNSVTIADKKLKAQLLNKISQYCYLLGKFTELGKFSNEAANISREINFKEGIIISLNTLSLKAYAELNYENAAKLNEEALSLSIEINSDKHKAESLYNLSFPLFALGEYDRSISLKEEAILLTRKLNDEHFSAQILLSISVKLLKFKKNPEKAVLLSEESLEISKKIDDKYLISLNLLNLASLYLYFENKDFGKAENILLEAYKISTEFDYAMNLFPIRIHLGVINTETGRYSEAEKIYKEYISEREKAGGEFYIKDVITGFARIFYKRDQYEDALKLYGFIDTLSKDKKYNSLHGSFRFNDDIRNKIRTELGEEKFNFAWKEGKDLSMNEVLSRCLMINNE